MARGLRLPVGVNPKGGVALVDSDANDTKIIFTALSACHNQHAWQQDIGLGDDMVFDLNEADVQSRIMRRLTTIFQQFVAQKRYKLQPDTVRFTRDSASQELRLAFSYINLESDEEQTFTHAFKRA